MFRQATLQTKYMCTAVWCLDESAKAGTLVTLILFNVIADFVFVKGAQLATPVRSS
jgi:hypothetical protein